MIIILRCMALCTCTIANIQTRRASFAFLFAIFFFSFSFPSSAPFVFFFHSTNVSSVCSSHKSSPVARDGDNTVARISFRTFSPFLSWKKIRFYSFASQRFDRISVSALFDKISRDAVQILSRARCRGTFYSPRIRFILRLVEQMVLNLSSYL